jgi:ubiquinone/menaquinone biosynthesis C-methylase UbiE
MSFEVLAPHYRWMEFLLAGEKLQSCRTAFLNQIAAAQNILIMGEGNGRFLAECRRQLQSARITCVDDSPRMLALAAARLKRFGLSLDQVEFIRADALTWKPPEHSFDLIVTHFFLDCFRTDQLEQLSPALARAATTRAIWLLADFQVPPRGWPRYRARLIHAIMYAFFRYVTKLPARMLTPPDPFLKDQDFVLRQRRTNDWGLLHSDYWERTGY